MPTEIQLDKEYTHLVTEKVIVPEYSVTFDKIKVEVIDNLVNEVQAKVWIEGVEDPYIMSLWNKDTTPTYESIGVWQNKDAIDRVIQILNLQ